MLPYNIPDLSALIIANNAYQVSQNLTRLGIRLGERKLTPELFWEAINSVEVRSQFEYEQLIFDALYVPVDPDAPFAAELQTASNGLNLGYALEVAFEADAEDDFYDYASDYFSEWTIVEWAIFFFFLVGVWATLQKIFER